MASNLMRILIRLEVLMLAGRVLFSRVISLGSRRHRRSKANPIAGNEGQRGVKAIVTEKSKRAGRNAAPLLYT
jgi:hypothetical protein